MSMTTCQNCCHYIDSDYDPDCFVTEGEKERVLCERCRENLPEDHPYWSAPTLAE